MLFVGSLEQALATYVTQTCNHMDKRRIERSNTCKQKHAKRTKTKETIFFWQLIFSMFQTLHLCSIYFICKTRHGILVALVSVNVKLKLNTEISFLKFIELFSFLMFLGHNVPIQFLLHLAVVMPAFFS